MVENPADVTIVQIDAHADLADNWAAAAGRMARSCGGFGKSGCRLVQVGIRSLSRPEFDLVRAARGSRPSSPTSWRRGGTNCSHTLARLEGPVYLSFDVDGLDPSIIPSTGTPQPNGLSWPQAMEVVRAVINSPCDLLGADVVEFIASPHPPGCDINRRPAGNETLGILGASEMSNRAVVARTRFAQRKNLRR